MADAFRRILYPTFVLSIIATVWTMGWAKASGERSERGYFPAENLELFRWDEPPAAQATAAR